MKTTDIPQLPELPEHDAPHFAALDLGSNSFHLITARLVNHDLQAVQKFKQKVGLGAGLKKNGHLSEKAIQRGLDALRLCAQRLEGFAPEQVKVVATHTLREAVNSDLFLARAADVLPYPIAIISGHEEARLIYHGVAQTTAGAEQRLVIDIGGGSTEIISGHGFEADYLASRSLGCVTYTERFFAKAQVTAKQFQKALVAARRELEPVAQVLRKYQHQQVFGTSGTMKAISLWTEKQDGATPGAIPLSELYRLRDQCIALQEVRLFSQLGIDENRAPLFAAGVAILIGIMEEFELTTVTAHDSALREGVLYELADSQLNHRDVRQRTIESLATRYFVDRAQAQRVRDCALDMLGQVKDNWALKGKEAKLFISWASLLHEVGLQINSSSLQRHSGYILAHSDMPGFNREEQRFIAALVANHRKKIKPSSLPVFSLYPQVMLLKLIALLRLSVLFNTDRQPAMLLLNTQVQNDVLVLTLTPQGKENPMLIADLESEAKQLKKIGIALHYH